MARVLGSFSTMGIIRQAMGRRHFAAALFREIIEREPHNARAWMFLGTALQFDGKLEGALEAHLKAVEFEETAQRGMYNAACAYALKGDKESAFAWLGRLHESGKFDMTRILVDPDLERLEDAPDLYASDWSDGAEGPTTGRIFIVAGR